MLNHQPKIRRSVLSDQVITGKSVFLEYLFKTLLMRRKHTVFEGFPSLTTPSFVLSLLDKGGDLIDFLHRRQFGSQFLIKFLICLPRLLLYRSRLTRET